MIAAAFVDFLGFGAVAAVCGGMFYLSNRIEPHWVAKDRRRFLTTAHALDQFGLPMGRRHEVRVNLEPDDDGLLIRRRSLTRGGSGIYHVQAKAPAAPKGKAVFIVKKVSGTSDVTTMALRFPASSPILPRIEELLKATGDDAQRRQRRAVDDGRPTGTPSYYPSDDDDTADDEEPGDTVTPAD